MEYDTTLHANDLEIKINHHNREACFASHRSWMGACIPAWVLYVMRTQCVSISLRRMNCGVSYLKCCIAGNLWL